MSWWRTRREELLSVARLGLPAQIIELATLELAARTLKRTPGIDRVYYATRGDEHRDVLLVLRRAGLRFICDSLERFDTLREHFPKLGLDRVHISLPSGTLETYAEALATGAHLILPDAEVLRRWPEIFYKQCVSMCLAQDTDCAGVIALVEAAGVRIVGFYPKGPVSMAQLDLFPDLSTVFVSDPERCPAESCALVVGAELMAQACVSLSAAGEAVHSDAPTHKLSQAGDVLIQEGLWFNDLGVKLI